MSLDCVDIKMASDDDALEGVVASLRAALEQEFEYETSCSVPRRRQRRSDLLDVQESYLALRSPRRAVQTKGQRRMRTYPRDATSS